MNKFFTKAISLAIGAAMIAGVGVAVGSSKAERVRAELSDVYVLDTTDTSNQTTNNTYGKTGTCTVSGVEWTFTGNGKMNPWRMGGKTAASGEQPFYTNTAISNAIDQIVVSFGSLSGLTASSFKMSVHNSASDAASGTGAIEEHTGLDIGANTTATIDLDSQQTGKFYRFVPDLTISASSNKYLELKTVTFKSDSDDPTPIETHSVIFNANGSDVTDMPDNLTNKTGTVSLTGVASPSREGYTFMGWSESQDGEVVQSVTVTDSDVNVYAIWEEIPAGDGNWTEATSLSVGDKVVLVSKDVGKEMTAISTTSTKYGIGSAFSDNPVGTFSFDVVAGSETNTYAFQNGSDYLSWSTGNSLATSTTLNANSSWTVDFSSGYASILNSSDNTREIWWNSNSPRFACYTGKTTTTAGYNAVQLYKYDDQPGLETLVIKLNDSETSPFELPYSPTSAGLFYANDSEGNDINADWSSSDETVFTVSKNGNNVCVLKSINPGTATLTASADGYKNGVATVTIVAGDVSSVVVSGNMTKTSYYAGESWSHAGLTATVNYATGYSYDGSDDVEWSYNPDATTTDVKSVVATATLGGKSGSSTAQDVTVTRTNPIQVVYTQTSGSVDVYGYYVGFLDGTGPVIMDGEYGIVVYDKTADVSGYTEKETILHVTGSISIYKGLYEIASASISVASGSFEQPDAPVVYATKGGETAEYASRLTTVTGIPTVTQGSFDEDAGKADIKMDFAVAGQTIQVYYKAAAQTADAEAFAAIKEAVENTSEITIKGFTGWYNGFQVQMNGYVPEAEGYTAEDFAEDLINQTDAICVNYVDGESSYSEYKTELEAVWSDLASNDKYPSLPSGQKAILGEADADEGGDVVEQAMARYDFLTVKYNLSRFINGRDLPASRLVPEFSTTIESDSAMIVVVIAAVTSLTSIAVLLVIKRRRALSK